MGRGRAKAKQIKVARKLKYYSPDTDLGALQKELGGETGHPGHADQYDDEPDYSEYADKYNVDDDNDDDEGDDYEDYSPRES